MHYTVCIVQYALYSMHCTLCIIEYALYKCTHPSAAHSNATIQSEDGPDVEHVIEASRAELLETNRAECTSQNVATSPVLSESNYCVTHGWYSCANVS